MLPKGNRSGFDSGTSANKRIEFMKLTEGRHIIRVLQPLEDAKLAYTHWVRGRSLACLDEATCPICANNQEILMSVGGEIREARKVAGYNYYQKRYYIHVLDVTPVKVSPSSQFGFENKMRLDGSWSATCGDTGEFLDGIEAKPSNTIKVLSGGVTLFGDLENVALGTLDEESNPLDITTYDQVLMVNGEGRDRQVTVIPQVNRNTEIDVDEKDFFDLDRALVTLEPDEIIDFVNGATLKDIFEARKLVRTIATESTPKVEERIQVTEEATADLSTSISDLLDK